MARLDARILPPGNFIGFANNSNFGGVVVKTKTKEAPQSVLWSDQPYELRRREIRRATTGGP